MSSCFGEEEGKYTNCNIFFASLQGGYCLDQLHSLKMEPGYKCVNVVGYYNPIQLNNTRTQSAGTKKGLCADFFSLIQGVARLV